MDEKSGPLKILRTKWLDQAQSSRLYILYFSDPRSHWVYSKSQYYQDGMRCCIMACLLEVLSDTLQSPQPLSHIHICPKPKVKLGPTDSIYPAPPSSLDIATATNPNQFGLTDGISISPRWACKLSASYCNNYGLTKICNRSHRVHNANSLSPFRNVSVQPIWANRSHRVCLTNSLVSLLPKLVSTSSCNWSHWDYVMP